MAQSTGTYKERQVQRILERAGYETVRSAGSKGACDIIAWNRQNIRLIQVKFGSARLSPQERETLSQLLRPPNATIEYWHFQKYKSTPRIEILA